jgi:osmoprotectant transport system ATP-binding protein
MAADPSIMLMDEPFAAIDNITRRRLQDELLDIERKVHKTILFVTHDVEEAIRLADRIAVMCEGKVVQYDTPLNILSAPADAFVAKLLGADDVLRRLSLLSVEHAMSRGPLPVGSGQPAVSSEQTPPTADGRGPGPYRKGPTITSNSNLRQALGLLLSSGADALTVVNAKGEPVGCLDLAAIRRLTHTPSIAA